MTMGGEKRGERRLVRVQINGVRKRVGSVATPEEADALRAAIHAGASDVLGVTLAAWGEEWLRFREKVLKIRGIRTERSRWETHIQTAPFYSRSIATITPDDIEAWVWALSNKTTATPNRAATPISIGTVRATVSLLRQCLGDAVPKQISVNPAADLRGLLKRVKVAMAQRAEVVHEPWTYLDPDEQRALLTHPQIPKAHRLIMAFAVFAGLRKGEQFNLTLSDVHVDGHDHAEPWITVRFGSKGKLPKNGKIRQLALNPMAATVLREWLRMLPEWAPKNPYNLVFPGPNGARMAVGKTPLIASARDPRNPQKVLKVDLFKRYVAIVGIKRDVRWHDLRHTCASSLISGWWGRRWTLDEVREALGHSSSTVTQRYAHLGKSAQREAAQNTTGWAPTMPTPSSKLPEVSKLSVGNHWVGRQGLEPWTYGLKVRAEPEGSQALAPPSGHDGGHDLDAIYERVIAALIAIQLRDPRAIDMLVRAAAEFAEYWQQARGRGAKEGVA